MSIQGIFNGKWQRGIKQERNHQIFIKINEPTDKCRTKVRRLTVKHCIFLSLSLSFFFKLSKTKWIFLSGQCWTIFFKTVWSGACLVHFWYFLFFCSILSTRSWHFFFFFLQTIAMIGCCQNKSNRSSDASWQTCWPFKQRCCENYFIFIFFSICTRITDTFISHFLPSLFVSSSLIDFACFLPAGCEFPTRMIIFFLPLPSISQIRHTKFWKLKIFNPRNKWVASLLSTFLLPHFLSLSFQFPSFFPNLFLKSKNLELFPCHCLGQSRSTRLFETALGKSILIFFPWRCTWFFFFFFCSHFLFFFCLLFVSFSFFSPPFCLFDFLSTIFFQDIDGKVRNFILIDFSDHSLLRQNCWFILFFHSDNVFPFKIKNITTIARLHWKWQEQTAVASALNIWNGLRKNFDTKSLSRFFLERMFELDLEALFSFSFMTFWRKLSSFSELNLFWIAVVLLAKCKNWELWIGKVKRGE